MLLFFIVIIWVYHENTVSFSPVVQVKTCGWAWFGYICFEFLPMGSTVILSGTCGYVSLVHCSFWPGDRQLCLPFSIWAPFLFSCNTKSFLEHERETIRILYSTCERELVPRRQTGTLQLLPTPGFPSTRFAHMTTCHIFLYTTIGFFLFLKWPTSPGSASKWSICPFISLLHNLFGWCHTWSINVSTI